MKRTIGLCIVSAVISFGMGYILRAPTTRSEVDAVPSKRANQRFATSPQQTQTQNSDTPIAERHQAAPSPVPVGFVAVPSRLMNYFFFNPFNLDFKLEPDIAEFLRLDSRQKDELQKALSDLKAKLDDFEASRLKVLKSDPSSTVFVLEGTVDEARELKREFQSAVRRAVPAPQCETFLGMSTHALTVATGDFGSKIKICRIAPRSMADINVVQGTYGLDTIVVDPSKLDAVTGNSDPFQAAAMVSLARSFDVFDELPSRYQHILTERQDSANRK